MEALQKLLHNLEDLLVKEFQACQALLTLTQEEREALIHNDVPSLDRLVERKEAKLDELGRLEEAKRTATQEISSSLGLEWTQEHLPAVADILAALDPSTATRLGRLCEGILILTEKVRNLAHGNRALATSALEHADAVQAFLLSLYQPLPAYGPQRIPTTAEPGLAWEIDQRA